MPQLTLASLGWDARFSSVLDGSEEDLFPARVARVDRGACDALSTGGPVRATMSRSLLALSSANPVVAPCVGDWLIARSWPDGRVTAESILPRTSAFVRAAVSPGSSQGQVLAANLDVAVVVEGLRPEPDVSRIERLLTLAWASGATPLVVLTKADQVPDAEQVRDEVASAAVGVEVLAVNARDATSLTDLEPYVGPGRTLALLGASGGGKSTLTNALAGAEIMPTRRLRADGKGRHTTVRRELVVLPGGGVVIDTPGLRSVGLAPGSDAIASAFADVEALALGCRFADCRHDKEPDCAIADAVASGTLPERRLKSYRKLLREGRWMAARHDARLRAQERAHWRRIHREVRASGRIRP